MILNETELNETETRARNLLMEKCPDATLIYLVVRGSHSYGTALPTSDIDCSGVFVQGLDDIVGLNYKEQVNDDNNDTTFFEVRRFLELLQTANPTVLELLYTPDDCVLYKHPAFDIIKEKAGIFLSKDCKNSFGGYAKQQVTKAKGQDKKQNWEKARVERKTPIDFCYAHIKEKSIPLPEILKDRSMQQDRCGLSRIPHARDLFALYYDTSERRVMGLRGIAFEDSNDIRLSSIPMGSDVFFVTHISYNKDEYSRHCKEYNEYQEWIKNRNEQRWVDVKNHGQKIDGKNMMHCVRLVSMAREIASGEGLKVRRSDAMELLKIRKGEVDLQSIIMKVESDMKEVDMIFEESNLPNKADRSEVNEMLLNVRKTIYGRE